jgi:transcriptional regulator with XRE-family HTH domain
MLFGMGKRAKNYIRDWRLKRKLSLRKLAARMESEPGVELISYASIGRIETGEQPYSGDILEALADALQVEPWMLLRMHPDKGGEIVDLVERLKPEQMAQALDLLKILLKNAG